MIAKNHFLHFFKRRNGIFRHFQTSGGDISLLQDDFWRSRLIIALMMFFYKSTYPPFDSLFKGKKPVFSGKNPLLDGVKQKTFQLFGTLTAVVFSKSNIFSPQTKVLIRDLFA